MKCEEDGDDKETEVTIERSQNEKILVSTMKVTRPTSCTSLLELNHHLDGNDKKSSSDS